MRHRNTETYQTSKPHTMQRRDHMANHTTATRTTIPRQRKDVATSDTGTEHWVTNTGNDSVHTMRQDQNNEQE